MAEHNERSKEANPASAPTAAHPLAQEHHFTNKIVKIFLESNLSLILIILASVLGLAASASLSSFSTARAATRTPHIARTTPDLAATPATLKDRAENHNAGLFDFRADDRFWFAYGQLYAYYGLMEAAQADFEDVIKEKHLQNLWDTMDQQFVSALKMQPFIIVNSNEQGIFASHLTTMGFYILRVRSNMVEISNVLAQ